MGAGILPFVFQNGKSFILSCNSKRVLECFRGFIFKVYFLKKNFYGMNFVQPSMFSHGISGQEQ